jgi:hypothetical protein
METRRQQEQKSPRKRSGIALDAVLVGVNDVSIVF